MPTHRWRGSLNIAAMAFVALTGCKASLDDGSASTMNVPARVGLVGNPAPAFRVVPVRGAHGALSLASLRGSVVILDFWGTYCGPCKRSFPKLQELSAKYAASGLHIVGISEDEAEDKGKITTFADSMGAKFTIGWDEDKSIAQRYGPEVMPSSFVIDKKGIVRYVHVGFHDGDEIAMRKEVESLLAQ